MADHKNTSVYVAAGREESRVNDRVMKLFSLRDSFHAITLVTPGKKISTPERLSVPPVIGVTGILRVLGLNSLKKAIDRYLYFPSLDIRFVWAVKRPLFARLRADLDAGRTAVVILTFPPHALGTLAAAVKKSFPDVRVVLDWQDLWSFDPNYFERSPELFRPKIYRWEQEFIESADLHLATNKRAAEILKTRYGAPPEKVSYIEHHYHPDDLVRNDSQAGQSDSPGSKEGPVRLAFMGTLDKPPRVPGRKLLEVIEQVNEIERRVEFHVYGTMPSLSPAEFQRAEDSGIVFHGLVSHEEATQALLDYDVLVLLLADMPNSRIVLSIKLPHYLLADKPILAIVPKDSAIADVIDATGAGKVVDTAERSVGSWQDELVELLVDGAAMSTLDSNRLQSAIDSYHWNKIAPRWMDAITGENTWSEEQ